MKEIVVWLQSRINVRGLIRVHFRRTYISSPSSSLTAWSEIRISTWTKIRWTSEDPEDFWELDENLQKTLREPEENRRKTRGEPEEKLKGNRRRTWEEPEGNLGRTWGKPEENLPFIMNTKKFILFLGEYESWKVNCKKINWLFLTVN